MKQVLELIRKIAYIGGPLTDLSPSEQACIKKFYEDLADVCERVTGARAFVPHEHYDPVKHAHYTPAQVDAAERRQVCELTSFLVVAAIAPSWGGGIEVEMANRSGVPIIILCHADKRISRLLHGNPAVRAIITYRTMDEALTKFEAALTDLLDRPNRPQAA